MYIDFFGLRELPFNNTPDPRFFYSTPDHEEALASLIYTVQERKGFVLLTGDVGAGKTLVSRMMLRRIGTQIAFANVNHAVQNASDLMESLCVELDLDFSQRATNAQLIRKLHDFLLVQFSQDIPVVLVLDEAQALPIEAFEQLRMIGNLEADDAKLLQIVIVGQPDLQRRFATRELQQLRQRIFRTFHLPALSREATEGYILHRLAVAGAQEYDIFDAHAIDRIYKHSQGLPRLINTICDNAMLSGYSADQRRLDGEFVESVIEQMMMAVRAEDAAELEPGARSGLEVPALLRAQGATATASREGCAGAAPVHAGAIDMLASRVLELESRLYQDVRRGKGDSELDDEPVARRLMSSVTGELDRLERELRSKVDDVGRRLAGFDQKFRAAPALLAESRAVHGRLESLIGHAKSVGAHTETVSTKLAQREAHVQELARKVTGVVEEVRRIFDGLRRAATKTGRATTRAEEVHNRLVAQADRSRELADRMTRVVDRLDQPGLADQRPVELVKEATGPIEGTAHPAREQDRFQQILSKSRESLSELRALVQGINHGPASPAASEGQPSASTEDPADETPTARLATQVDGLLALVEQE